jgi:hypothetical protein
MVVAGAAALAKLSPLEGDTREEGRGFKALLSSR